MIDGFPLLTNIYIEDIKKKKDIYINFSKISLKPIIDTDIFIPKAKK